MLLFKQTAILFEVSCVEVGLRSSKCSFDLQNLSVVLVSGAFCVQYVFVCLIVSDHAFDQVLRPNVLFYLTVFRPLPLVWGSRSFQPAVLSVCINQPESSRFHRDCEGNYGCNCTSSVIASLLDYQSD